MIDALVDIGWALAQGAFATAMGLSLYLSVLAIVDWWDRRRRG